MTLIAKPRTALLNKSHPLAHGLVGAWFMNEGAGSEVRDLSGHGNHGTLQGDVSWARGDDSPVLDFDGSRASVLFINENSTLNPSSELTLYAKFNIRAFPNSFPRLIAKDGDTTDGNQAYHLLIDSGDDKPFFRVQNTATTWFGGQFDTVLFTDTVYTMAGVLTGQDGTLKCYVNGKQEATTYSFTGSVNTSDQEGVGIGNGIAPNDRFAFDGHIYAAYIYNRALSPAEIRALHRDPYQMIRPSRPWLVPALAGGVSQYSFGTINNASTIGSRIIQRIRK